ncbi:MAG: flagellar biosynthesis protein FliP, partial [Actinomycetota bacterium]|nr:flagellar biosynthesis protein FliP [Actinomycetota bacterium]
LGVLWLFWLLAFLPGTACAAAPVARSVGSAMGAVALTGPLAALPPRAPATPLPPTQPSAPAQPSGSSTSQEDGGDITVGFPQEPSRVVQLIVLMTVLGVAPAILLMCTAFTKIVVVLSLTRSAVGTTTIPPNQVLVGLALFLSLFVMAPTLDQMQSKGISPYMSGSVSATVAYGRATEPLRDFMLQHTRDEELALITKAAARPQPESPEDVDLRTLIPSFVLSELRAAFIIGFVVFVPFLVIDIVVSAILMSLGMVMLPPSIVSLPFKILLFVLVDGWSLVVTTLIGSYR